MAVQISEDIPSSEEELDPQYVATAFVEQYYLLLQKSPELVHKFYNEQSILDRPRPDRGMVSMMTVQSIKDEIMSSDYKGCSFDAINLDAQASVMGGVLVAVNGNFIGKDNLKKSFNQTFFLAKQPRGYFVQNDILRFLGELESETVPTSNDTKENACNVPITHDEETPAQPKEVIDDGEKVSGVENANKTVSDIKDTMAEAPNDPLNGSENESTLTHVASNEKPEIKTFSYASVLLAKLQARAESLTNNTGYKIVRVAPNADQQSSAPATLRDPGMTANSAKEELIANNVAAENNNAPADAPASKNIYIANLPRNITKHRLADALKIFGHVRHSGVQIRTCEDGFCYGFVEFDSASSASKAIEAHNVTVGENVAYMMYKKSAGGSRSGNSGGNGGSRGDNYKGQDTREIHSSGSYRDDNQADMKGQPRASDGQNEETDWKTPHKVGRAYSKSRRLTDERSNAGEAYKENNHTRTERRNNGNVYQKKNNKKR